MSHRLKIAFPYLLILAMVVLLVWSNINTGRVNPKDMPSANQLAIGDLASDHSARKLIDPVCNMQVNKAWGFEHTHAGKTTHFCSKRCEELFVADSSRYTAVRCLVCDEPINHAAAFPATYLDQTYLLDNETCRAEFKADPAGYFMHSMWGLPDWLYYLSIALLLLISFFMFEGSSFFRKRNKQDLDLPESSSGVNRIKNAPYLVMEHFTSVAHRFMGQQSKETPSPASVAAISLPILHQPPDALPPRSQSSAPSANFDLLRFKPLRWLATSRITRFVIQLFMVLAFVLIIAAGLFGNQNPALNIAPLLTWTIWWGGLVVLIMFASKAWCYMCPWEAASSWIEKLQFWKKSDDGLGLNMKWPKRLRNIWLATFLFIGLTWAELGFGITMSPSATAYMGIAMFVLTLVCTLTFDRKSFCRYGCLVGRVSGLYALFGGTEVRSVDPQVCLDCKTKECIKGSDEAYGCPTFLYPGKMEVNTYCIQCAECLQSCPHQNMTVRLRPWGQDLGQAAEGKPRSDEAYLALLMLAISGFHGLTMTPVWRQLTGAIESAMPIGRIAAFTSGMAILMILPILVYAALVYLSMRMSASVTEPTEDDLYEPGGQRVSYRDYFIRYAYCTLPIALFYHLAHNLEHLLMEGPKVIALISDPFGWGWNVFGTAQWHIAPMVSLDVLWIMQVFLVAIGHVYSLWAARTISRKLYSNPVAASRGQWPMLIGMIVFSIFSLWLLKQPMEMRSSAM